METVIFYSWQSDLPNATNRGFIESSLKTAIKAVRRDERFKLDLRLESDTRNTPGTPDISNTIFDKIEKARIFVADVSIINRSNFLTRLPILKWLKSDRLTPNPNVLIELGYAARHMTWTNIICVFNAAYGSVEELPFDIRKRRILSYTMSEKAIERGVERGKLAKAIQVAVETIVDENRTTDEFRKEVLLEISLACHSWKTLWMSLSPIDFREEEGQHFDDVWQLMFEISKRQYSSPEWIHFRPLFSDGINSVVSNLDRLVAMHNEVIPLELKTLIVQSKRQLVTEQVAYFGMNEIPNVEDKNVFFSARFLAVTDVLSKLAKKAESF